MQEKDPSSFQDSRYDWYQKRNEEAIQTDIPSQEQAFDEFLPYLLEKFPETEHASLTWAYTTARNAHEIYSKPRKSGQLYFGHIVGVTRTAIEEFMITNPAIIKALLVHDVFEDTPEVIEKRISEMNYCEWREKAKEKLIPHIGTEATDIVLALTRPQPNGDDIPDEATGIDINEKELSSSPVFLVAKAADVLDNFRTLTFRKIPRQNETIETLRNFYIREFIKHVDDRDYGETFHYILTELMIAVGRIKMYQASKEEDGA